MDVSKLMEQLEAGKAPQFLALIGEESFLIERALCAVRAAVLPEGASGWNQDIFFAGSTTINTILNTAKTLPMMSAMRLVLVRDLDELDAADLDAFIRYVENPVPSTCLVCVAKKLDGRSRLAKLLKEKKMWVEAAPLRAALLVTFLQSEARRRGHALKPDVAKALIEQVGEELTWLDDALERLSLYVGSGAPIDVAALNACIATTRVESIWKLVDAVGAQDTQTALGATLSLLSDREPPLKIFALISRQFRLLAKMSDALAQGQTPTDAAKHAGAPPFKASELAQAARRLKNSHLQRVFQTLRDADLRMKSSRVPAETILTETLLRLSSSTTS